MSEAGVKAKQTDECVDNEDNDDSTEDDGEVSEEDAGEDKEGEEAANGDSDTEKREKIKLLRKRAHNALSGRGITLAMLLADGIIEPGADFMSLDIMVNSRFFRYWLW